MLQSPLDTVENPLRKKMWCTRRTFLKSFETWWEAAVGNHDDCIVLHRRVENPGTRKKFSDANWILIFTVKWHLDGIWLVHCLEPASDCLRVRESCNINQLPRRCDMEKTKRIQYYSSGQTTSRKDFHWINFPPTQDCTFMKNSFPVFA